MSRILSDGLNPFKLLLPLSERPGMSWFCLFNCEILKPTCFSSATSQIILLPGNNWTSAATFVSNGSADALSKVTNPDGSITGLVFDVHKYLDFDNSYAFILFARMCFMFSSITFLPLLAAPTPNVSPTTLMKLGHLSLNGCVAMAAKLSTQKLEEGIPHPASNSSANKPSSKLKTLMVCNYPRSEF